MNTAITRQATGLFLLILLLISYTGLAQENTVYQSHPFDLAVDQARPAPFQLMPVDPATINGCCLSNFPGWAPNLPFLNQWQGIPYRQDFYILDGSINHSDSRIYRSGSVYTGFRIEGNTTDGNRQMVQDRVIVLPGN